MGFTVSGGGSGAITIADDNIFTNDAARDTYFTANPSELVADIYIQSGSNFEQWVNGVWQDVTAVIRGPTGLTGNTGASGITYSLRSVNTGQTINITDNTVIVDASAGNVIIAMPAGSTCTSGQIFNIKKIDGSTNSVTVTGAIDDGINFILSVKNQSVTLSADVANNKFWII